MSICYEHPLNERIRLFLRLNHLFQQFDYSASGDNYWQHRWALSSLFDLLELLQRNEIKAEIIKELERHSKVFKRLQDSPGIDHSALEAVQNEIQRISGQIRQFSNLTLDSYRQQEFLTAVRQRSSIPGGTCVFDLPELHFWLEYFDQQHHHTHLQNWLANLQPLRDGIDLILKLLRGSSIPRQRTADHGVYQQTLDEKANVQLLRIMIDQELPVYPQVSGSHHRFTIRFLQLDNPHQKAVKYSETLQFALACCAL